MYLIYTYPLMFHSKIETKVHVDPRVWRKPLGAERKAGTTTLIVILMSTSLGAFVPLTLERLRIDPALATGPFVTTTNDILGILVYLTLASWLLVG